MLVDMDCFFVSVAIRNKPELKNKPCAVSHSKSTNSESSEISSANYEARKYGIKNGMWMGTARKLCPHLIVLPYNFDEYLQISKKIYEIFWNFTNIVQCTSIDEAFLAFPKSQLFSINPKEEMSSETSSIIVEIANEIRAQILQITKCPASYFTCINIFKC